MYTRDKKTEFYGTFSVISVIIETTKTGPISDTDTNTKNMPKYLVFYFPDRRYNFAKLLQKTKLLLICMTLVTISV